MNKFSIILFSVIFFLVVKDGFSQTESLSVKKIQHLSDLYHSNKLNKKAYLDSVHLWYAKNEQDGIFFKIDSLKKYLQLFKSIAESDTSFAKFNSNYYAFLGNNEAHKGNTGLFIYYIDKYDKQNFKSSGKKSYSALAAKSNFFNEVNNYKKVIEVYEDNLAYIATYPHLLDADSINLNVALNSAVIFNNVAKAYAYVGDTAGLQNAISLGEKVKQAFLKKVIPNSMQAYVMMYNIVGMYFSEYFTLLKDMPLTRQVLEQKRNLIYGDTATVKKRKLWSEIDFVGSMIQYHLKIKNIDSAAYYLKIFKSIPLIKYYNADLNLYEAQIFQHKNMGDSAYMALQRIISVKDTSLIMLTGDMDGLLNAYIQAEEKQEALNKAEVEKKKRNEQIFYISILLGLVVFTGFYLMRKRSLKLQKRIEHLKIAVDLEVAQLEEKVQSARQLEQEKLGMELHDNMASQLAALLYITEMHLQDATDSTEKERLLHTKTILKQTYEMARNKSHELVYNPRKNSEESFSQRVKVLLDNALPDGKYKKDVQIDDYSLSRIQPEKRIELLRIIQESVTNILKHAKAKTVWILMYEDCGLLNLSIKDDGKGFDANRKNKSLGIYSIKNRVVSVNGQLNILSGNMGTEINVEIPF